MNNTGLEFSGGLSFVTTESTDTYLSGHLESDWSFLSGFVAQYLEQNRGQKLNTEHYRKVVHYEIERMLTQKAHDLNREVLAMNIELPKDFTIHSHSLKAKVLIDWFPVLPEINIDDIAIKQYKLHSFTSDEISEFKDVFLDSYKVPVEWDGPIEKGDIIRALWKWKLDEQDSWSDDTTESQTIKVAINPRFDPEIEKKLIGSTKGATVEHTIKVPSKINEGSVNPEFSQYIKEIVRFAGKTISLKIEVLDVQRLQRPSLDSELLGKLKLDSENDLEERITKNIFNYMDAQNAEIGLAQILNYLRTFDVAIPDRHVDQETGHLIAKFAHALNIQPTEKGYDFNSHEFQNSLMDAIKQEFKDWNYQNFADFETRADEVARSVLIGDLMIHKIGKMLNLSEKELEGNILQAWMSMDENRRNAMNLNQKQEYYKNMRNRVILGKFLNILKSENKIIEVESKTLKEFEAAIMQESENALYTKYFANNELINS